MLQLQRLCRQTIHQSDQAARVCVCHEIWLMAAHIDFKYKADDVIDLFVTVNKPPQKDQKQQRVRQTCLKILGLASKIL